MAEKAAPKSAKATSKLDLATVGGLVMAVGFILGGLLLEGGKVKDVSQFTAGMIVLGGTFGAVMVTTPMDVLMGAVKRLPSVFMDRSTPVSGTIEQILYFAGKARREGIVALEQESDAVEDLFLRKILNLAVDGTDLEQIRKTGELEISLIEEHGHAEAKVFEAAGGYAPTVGIIGAVLGLIQVMKNLANIDEVGRGIAVAFVATVYGVASANIFFLPAAAKLKARTRNVIRDKELTLEGVIGIVEGLNPKLIRSKLEAYETVGGHAPAAKGEKKAGARAAAAEA